MAEPVRVGDVLAILPGMADRLAEARLVQAWAEIAGPAAPRTQAEHVDGGVLHVRVDSSAWLHRLTLETPMLLPRCRAVADVRGIRFHLAPLELRPPGLTPASARPAAPPPDPVHGPPGEGDGTP